MIKARWLFKKYVKKKKNIFCLLLVMGEGKHKVKMQKKNMQWNYPNDN